MKITRGMKMFVATMFAITAYFSLSTFFQGEFFTFFFVALSILLPSIVPLIWMEQLLDKKHTWMIVTPFVVLSLILGVVTPLPYVMADSSEFAGLVYFLSLPSGLLGAVANIVSYTSRKRA